MTDKIWAYGYVTLADRKGIMFERVELLMIFETGEDMKCKHKYESNTYCGVRVCSQCKDHKGLARCYCGWSASGSDGRQELVEMGEVIEPEDY